jgi:hypothetical protein
MYSRSRKRISKHSTIPAPAFHQYRDWGATCDPNLDLWDRLIVGVDLYEPFQFSRVDVLRIEPDNRFDSSNSDRAQA